MTDLSDQKRRRLPFQVRNVVRLHTEHLLSLSSSRRHLRTQDFALGHQGLGTANGLEEAFLSRKSPLEKCPCSRIIVAAGKLEDIGKQAFAGPLVPDDTSGQAVEIVKPGHI